ncbi:hypothetical protein BM1_00051 [Bipolaris maydis]|nr:hypothetical protein BM1_00051 [Bipolaris maydis]
MDSIFYLGTTTLPTLFGLRKGIQLLRELTAGTGPRSLCFFNLVGTGYRYNGAFESYASSPSVHAPRKGALLVQVLFTRSDRFYNVARYVIELDGTWNDTQSIR